MVFGKKKTKTTKKKAEPKKTVMHTCAPRSDKSLCAACVAEK